MTPGRRTPMRPTMADVAAEADVSVKTVSRVINHQGAVRQTTVERVRSAAELLGFRRPVVQASVGTAAIGLVGQDLGNPFYAELAAAIEREARTRQYELLTASAEGSPTRERHVLTDLIGRRVDGLIVVPAGATPRLDRGIAACGVPAVYVDQPPRDRCVDMVLGDNPGGVRSAVEHLVAHGHRGLGFLGDDPRLWTARRRRDAFASTHRELRLPNPVRIAMGPHSSRSVGQQLTDWMRGPCPVSALLTGNNRVTLAALRATRSLGLRRKGGLSTVCYDDFECAQLLDPPITAVHQDPAVMGQRAAHLLFDRLLGDGSPPRRVVVPTRLIVRG